MAPYASAKFSRYTCRSRVKLSKIVNKSVKCRKIRKKRVCHVRIAIAMSLYDDVIYLGLLIFSIAVGNFLRPPIFPTFTKAARKWLSSAIGLAIVFLVSGMHGLHCVVALALQVKIS